MSLKCFGQDSDQNNQIEKNQYRTKNFTVTPIGITAYRCKVENNGISVNVGTINYEEDRIKYKFNIENMSEEPLVIKRAYWAEPVFGPVYNSDTIFKGQRQLFEYYLSETHRPGHIYKTGYISTNHGDFSIHFKGVNLPPQIFLNKTEHIDSISLGDSILSKFRIYNYNVDQMNSTIVSQFPMYNMADVIDTFVIRKVVSDDNTTVRCDSIDSGIIGSFIASGSYREFKVCFLPNKSGKVYSKIVITIENINYQKNNWGRFWDIEYYIFTEIYGF